MRIFIFGNPDLEEDSLPLRLLPELRKRFPAHSFEVKDPNEEWDIPDELVIIDTVVGTKEVALFTSLSAFQPAPRITMHDFDAFANLRYLEKLGRLKSVRIIGVPPAIGKEEALEKIGTFLSQL